MAFDEWIISIYIMKKYPEKIDLREIWKFFEGYPLAHIATIEGNQPRVRPMSLISTDNELWLATKTEWDKVNQIAMNNKVEFTIAPLNERGTGSVRATATAVIIKDRETRQRISQAIPWFNQYWTSPDDPNFTLIQLILMKVLHDHPTDLKKYTVKVT